MMDVTTCCRYVALVFTVAMSSNVRFAIAQDSVDLTLEAAKQKHHESVSKAKNDILYWFDNEDARARNRKSGVSDQVAKLALERKAYDDNEILPSSAPIGLKTQTGKANDALVRAYKKALDDLYREQRDDEAKVLQAEMEQFLASLTPTETFLNELSPTSTKTAGNKFSAQGILVGTGIGEITVSIAGKKRPHSIFLHPPTSGSSTVTYQLDKKWRKLQSTVLVPRVGDEKKGIGSPVTFKVYGDGKLLWTSVPIRGYDLPQDLAVDIGGVDSLQLETSCGGDSSYARAVWIDPLLKR